MKYIKIYENFQSEQEIDEICRTYGIENYTIEDGVVNVDNNVSLGNYELYEIPLTFGEVTGGFYCQSNTLYSLVGCPKVVHGNFLCNDTSIDNLEYGPVMVDGDYECSECNLESLKGAPTSIKGTFDCSNSKLETLEFCPNDVGSFYCGDNILTSLEGCPTNVRGSFDCSRNQIYDLVGIGKISDTFYCIGNPIYEIWSLFNDESKIELFNYFDPIRPPKGDKPICYLDRLNGFLEEIGKKPVTKLREYKCL